MLFLLPILCSDFAREHRSYPFHSPAFVFEFLNTINYYKHQILKKQWHFATFIPDNRMLAERAFYCCIPFFRPLSPHSPCIHGISRSGAPCRPQPPHGPDVRNNLSGKLHLQSRNPASDPHWKKEALLYVPEWKADRESALQALPDQL